MKESFQYKVKILEHHLDTFGHVNNATYLELYEEARWQFITENGYGIKEIQEKEIGPVILDLHLKFKKELKNRTSITIYSGDIKMSGRFTTMKQWMVNERDEVASTLDLTFGLMDLQKRSLINNTPDWKKALGLSS